MSRNQLIVKSSWMKALLSKRVSVEQKWDVWRNCTGGLVISDKFQKYGDGRGDWLGWVSIGSDEIQVLGI